ncbi:MAG TPA: hypothetical protein VLA93_06900 [Pyrinomonadaceae bacterium]|nr:hypothetical protein [Pyrinomonadaceae bacterium]
MFSIKKSALLAGLFCVSLLFTACPSQTNISKITSDPGRYRNKEVGIVGTVTDSYGIPGYSAYEIDDGTGRLWVVTKRGAPARGSRVGTKGHVYNGLTWAGRSFGTVLQETDRRTKGT